MAQSIKHLNLDLGLGHILRVVRSSRVSSSAQNLLEVLSFPLPLPTLMLLYACKHSLTQINLYKKSNGIVFSEQGLFGTKGVIDNTACKVANSETMNLGKNPNSVNISDKRRLL